MSSKKLSSKSSNIMPLEAFLEAWIKNGKLKTWREFAEAMNVASTKAGYDALDVSQDYKELHLRCAKVQDVANKAGYIGTYQRPSRPAKPRALTMKELLASNPKLRPTG